MRIRIPNGTTWSDTLPLEHVEGEGKGQHRIVQVIMKLIYTQIERFLMPVSACRNTKNTNTTEPIRELKNMGNACNRCKDSENMQPFQSVERVVFIQS